jgi:DNA-binding XRE family transcriptional regulator/uncharacterized phage-associated protein
MDKKNTQFIKKLRETKNLSQQEVANKLNIARTSYLAIEQGKRDFSLPEANTFSNLFGIDIEDLNTGIVPDYKKYKEMILAYLRIAGNKVDGCIPKTKLAKLLYLSDFAWFYNNLKSMSGMKYRKIKYGPVPDIYFRAITELEEDGIINITRKDDSILISESEAGKQNKLENLNKEEKELIKKITEKWKNRRTSEIVKFTHQQLPYSICEENEIIPYELITQEDPEYVY